MADPHVILFEGGHHPPLFRKTENTNSAKPVEYETLMEAEERTGLRRQRPRLLINL